MLIVCCILLMFFGRMYVSSFGWYSGMMGFDASKFRFPNFDSSITSIPRNNVARCNVNETVERGEHRLKPQVAMPTLTAEN